MGKWANDASNWNQKWELIDGAICLKNIPADPETEENIPWFAVEPKEEDSTPKNSKAPLWSTPIRKSTGMRCITMDYNIYVDSDELEGYSLAVLQQQDGWILFAYFIPNFSEYRLRDFSFRSFKFFVILGDFFPFFLMFRLRNLSFCSLTFITFRVNFLSPESPLILSPFSWL